MVAGLYGAGRNAAQAPKDRGTISRCHAQQAGIRGSTKGRQHVQAPVWAEWTASKERPPEGDGGYSASDGVSQQPQRQEHQANILPRHPHSRETRAAPGEDTPASPLPFPRPPTGIPVKTSLKTFMANGGVKKGSEGEKKCAAPTANRARGGARAVPAIKWRSHGYVLLPGGGTTFEAPAERKGEGTQVAETE